jgi:hypothetical protein
MIKFGVSAKVIGVLNLSVLYTIFKIRGPQAFTPVAFIFTCFFYLAILKIHFPNTFAVLPINRAFHTFRPAFGVVIGAVFGILFGVALQTFVLIWFSRRKIVEEVATWR